MDLAAFPRRPYTNGPTPIQRLDRFSRALGADGPTVYIKRDDQLGLAGGGNKARKLEFLVADALARGADTLITCGGVQSNHCRLTLSAAAKEGLRCRLVLAESAPGAYRPEGNGNVLLYRLLGAERITTVPWGTGWRPWIRPAPRPSPKGAGPTSSRWGDRTPWARWATWLAPRNSSARPGNPRWSCSTSSCLWAAPAPWRGSCWGCAPGTVPSR